MEDFFVEAIPPSCENYHHVSVRVFVYVSACMCVFVFVHMCANMCVCMFVYVCASMCVCVCVCV